MAAGNRRRPRASSGRRRPGPRRARTSFAAYIAASASASDGLEADPRAGAEHRDADAGGDPRHARPRSAACSRIAVAIASATLRASPRRSAAGRSRTRRRRAGPARRSRASALRSTPAISAITRSPAGWPSVSLTRLKLSRSSISSAPAVPSRRLRASSVRRSSSKRRRFFSPVSGSWLAWRCSSCIRSLRLQTRTSAPSSAASEMPDDRDQQRQADAGPARVVDDQQPGAVGDP